MYTQAATWADKGDGEPLLVLAGTRGIVKVINTITLAVDAALIGHGNEILDVTTHSVDTNLIISASKDESVRLWNIKTQICIAIFAGEKGHRNHVLSVCVHPCGNVVASSGMDYSIKLWNLVSPDVQNAINKSYSHDDRAGNIGFVSVPVQFPLFSTDKVHTNYVDCIKWVGDLLLSKSLCNRAVLWTPDPLRGSVCIVGEYELTHCRNWFMKMSCCDLLYVFAAGNTMGEVLLFHLTPPSEDEDAKAATHFLSEIEKANRDHDHERFETGVIIKPHGTICHDSGSSSIIRDSDFSMDGDHFIYCADSSHDGQGQCQPRSKICVWSVDHLETHHVAATTATTTMTAGE